MSYLTDHQKERGESSQTTIINSEEGIFKQKVLPRLNSIINSSSGFMSNIIGFAEGLWDKKEVPAESSIYSSSIIYEDSPEILVLCKQKVYGSRERFSEEFGIHLRKLRNGRFSEHMPKKTMFLNVDSDVQPEIVSVRDYDQRKRTESCYPRIGNEKSALELGSISGRKNEASRGELSVNDSVIRNPLSLMNSDENRLLQKVYIKESINCVSSDEVKSCKSQDLERSLVEEPRANMSCVEELHDIKEVNRCRSLESVSVSINGKIFRYFDKTQLCSIPVVSFKEFCEKLSKTSYNTEGLWKHSIGCSSLCCFKSAALDQREKEDLEKVIVLSLTEFEPRNELHLVLLLGTFVLVTGEKDWPGLDKDWLKLGFSSVDLKKELSSGGLIALFFLFFLAERFRGFLQELLRVSIFYSFEVFEVIKRFSLDGIELLRLQKLNSCFSEKGQSVCRFFLFVCGMLVKWFKFIVLNKDFAEMHRRVLSEAKTDPAQFIAAAEKMKV